MVIKKNFSAAKVTKDGVTIARSAEFKDKIKNIGASIVKQVMLPLEITPYALQSSHE